MDLNIMRCTHCGSAKYVKNGHYQGSQRFRCKNCLRYFSDKVRKFNYSDKEKFLQLYLKNTGIRNAAIIIGCSPSLLVRWVRELAGNLRDLHKIMLVAHKISVIFLFNWKLENIKYN